MVWFVLGAVEVEYPLWFRSWRNIGHQSVLDVLAEGTLASLGLNAALSTWI
jgi:hypothetical protein